MNNSTDLSLYDNSWYPPTIGAGKFKRTCWYLVNIIFFLNPLVSSSSLKRLLLRIFGAKVGIKVILKPGINIKYPWKLQIGAYSWIGEKVWIDNLDIVEIGKNVCISQGAMLLTGNHDYTKTGFDLFIGKIKLEDGVWLGAKSLVCPGITCYSHSVLSAMSVATKNLDAYTIYQGNPAAAIKHRIIE